MLRSHNGRSPINLSPDGAWIAHTVETEDTVPRASRRFSATGKPFAEGDSRMEATVTRMTDGTSILLGSPEASSWAAVWSPDSTRVAFYADTDGESGLWVWELAAGSARRLGDTITRSYFGFEMPLWSPDGQHLLTKVLREGMSLSDAEGLQETPTNVDAQQSGSKDEQPMVAVRRVVPREKPAAAPLVDDAPEPEGERLPPEGDVGDLAADLALINAESGEVERLVLSEAVRDYAFSPDGRYVAYSTLKGYEPASQQPNYDVLVYELASGSTRRLGSNLRLGYGIEWSWSPDSQHVAWIPSGQMARQAVADGARERIVIASIDDGRIETIVGDDAPTLDPGDGEHRPLWTPDGMTLFGVGDGSLWAADRASGSMRQLASLPGWRVRAIVSPDSGDTVWTTDDGGTTWVVARSDDGSRSGIHAIDIGSGESRAEHVESAVFSGIFNVDGNAGSGEIVYVSTDQRRLQDIWSFDTRNGTARKVTSINTDLEKYALGEARVIHWRGLDGEPLSGALLLPPGYEAGERLPMVVWVYAGSMGSTYLHRFGFMGDLSVFNMHVLATRGYAVLFPDVPTRLGSPVSDVMRSVMPGVNAAIDNGYADPERLAIMGQSYGSYNVLGVITRTTRFKAAVITAAVVHPDLFAAYLGGTGYYEQGQGSMGGTIWEYPERYRENSPLFRFDRIETPLLIGQGESDGNLVPSEAIFSALERLDKPVEYRLYAGEGHVITQRPNVLDFWRRRLEFLSEHLDLEVDNAGRVAAR